MSPASDDDISLPEPADNAIPAATPGQLVDDGRGRMFPCAQCGADLEFHIGLQSLRCDFCGHVQQLEISAENDVQEQDFHAILSRIRERRQTQQQHRDTETAAAPGPATQHSEITCGACSGTVEFYGTLSSTTCPWCGNPVQLEGVHQASEERLPVDGMLPFRIDRDIARRNLANWVRSRWFAPNSFLRNGVEGKFQGVFLPYFTFDAMTATAWSGRRGDHYYVTVGSGKDQRRVRRTSWRSVSGRFQRFFDDVCVLAGKGLRRDLIQALEPWPLTHIVPFNPQLMAGITARTYDIELDDCFAEGKRRMDEAIHADVRQRIGGDEQVVSSVNTHYAGITFKHLLLPAWLMTYRWNNKPWQVFINATTGEVQGERPWSVWKITLAVLAAIATAAAIWFWFEYSHNSFDP
ncbi:MAG: hypothetical protein ACKO2P_03375 [Planctomycetota bacterium]